MSVERGHGGVDLGADLDAVLRPADGRSERRRAARHRAAPSTAPVHVRRRGSRSRADAQTSPPPFFAAERRSGRSARTHRRLARRARAEGRCHGVGTRRRRPDAVDRPVHRITQRRRGRRSGLDACVVAATATAASAAPAPRHPARPYKRRRPRPPTAAPGHQSCRRCARRCPGSPSPASACERDWRRTSGAPSTRRSRCETRLHEGYVLVPEGVGVDGLRGGHGAQEHAHERRLEFLHRPLKWRGSGATRGPSAVSMINHVTNHGLPIGVVAPASRAVRVGLGHDRAHHC